MYKEKERRAPMKFLGLFASVLLAFSCIDDEGNEYKVIVVENAGKVVKASFCSTVAYIYKQNGKREKIVLPKQCEQQQIQVAWCNQPHKQIDCHTRGLLVGLYGWGNWPFDLYLHTWKKYIWQEHRINDLYGGVPYKVGDRITVGYLEDSTGKFVLKKGIQVMPYVAPPSEADPTP